MTKDRLTKDILLGPEAYYLGPMKSDGFPEGANRVKIDRVGVHVLVFIYSCDAVCKRRVVKGILVRVDPTITVLAPVAW